MAERAGRRKHVPTEGERRILDIWPRFEDGELVMPGDKVHYASAYNDETEIEVESITAMDGYFVLCDDECRSNQYEQGQRVKRPVQSVLDADGVEIKAGDTVWFRSLSTGDGMRSATVTGFGERNLDVRLATVEDEAGRTWNIDPKRITHTRPDSWELLEEDVSKSDPCEYFGFEDVPCEGCPAERADNCGQTMAHDFMRRAKALAGVGADE